LQSLSSSLSSMGLSAPIFQTDTIASTSVSLDEGIRIAERSYRLASDIGWRSGRVFALCTMAMCLIAVGNFDRAITSIGEGIQIAEEIGHRQWETYLSTCNGALFLELLNWEKAQDHLEKGLAMAELNHSPHWVHTISGALASALVAKGDLSAAEKVLDRYLAPETPHQTLGQRLAWFARSELALASGRLEDAMEIARMLSIETHSGVEGEMVIRLWLLKGEILVALADKSLDMAERKRLLDDAEELLSAVLEETRRKNYRTRVWRIHKALARLQEKQGRVIDAERERQAAREIVLELSGQISDPDLRSTFVRGALGG
ncbi:MAG TPA: hypothetical protein VF823_03740, partial [Anaerolineales bacterium]